MAKTHSHSKTRSNRKTKTNKGLISSNFLSKKAAFVFIFIFAVVGAWVIHGSYAAEPFNHPGILVSQSQLDFVKDKVQKGQEPWISSYNKMKSSRFAKKDYRPSAVPKLMCSASGGLRDGYPQAGCDEFNNDGAAAYVQALMYQMTGEQVYANNAANIIKAWSNTLKEIPYNQPRATDGTPAYWQNLLVVGWSTETMTRGAEIIRYSSNAMSSADISKFETWLTGTIYPFLKENTSDSNGNGGMTWSESLVNIGVYTNRRDIYNKGIDWYRKKVPQMVYLSKDGTKPQMVTDSEKSPGEKGYFSYGTVEERWRHNGPFINGLETETCRDMGHTFMGLGPMSNIAETVLIQGTSDLYGEFEDRFLAAYELNADYVNQMLDRMAATGQTATQVKDSSWKPSNFPCADFKDGGNSAFLGTELAYNHFVNRRGKSMPNTKRLMERVRPQSGGNHLFYETLTHANVGMAGISSIETPAQNQPVNNAFLASDDTYVRDGSYANNSYGDSKLLPVTGKDPTNGYTRWVYLKFDVSSMDEGIEVTDATMSIEGRLASGSSSTIDVFEISNTSWKGSTMTWNNKPALGSKIGEIKLSSSASSRIAANVTSSIKKQISQGKKEIAFALRQSDSSSSFSEFKSAEGSDAPVLSVTGTVGGSGSSAPADTTPPVGPTSLTAKASSTTQINLSWPAATDASGVKDYIVYRNGSILKDGVTATSYSDTGLKASTSYSYQVKARDTKGNISTGSPTVSAKTDAPAPVTPPADNTAPTQPGNLTRSLRFDAGSFKYYLDLAWSASQDASGIKEYQVWRNGALLGTTSSTKYSDGTMAPNIQYSYSVIAVDNAPAANKSIAATTKAQGSCFLIWCSLK